MTNLRVVNWARMVRRNPQWLAGDGVHVNADGYRARARRDRALGAPLPMTARLYVTVAVESLEGRLRRCWPTSACPTAGSTCWRASTPTSCAPRASRDAPSRRSSSTTAASVQGSLRDLARARRADSRAPAVPGRAGGAQRGRAGRALGPRRAAADPAPHLPLGGHGGPGGATLDRRRGRGRARAGRRRHADQADVARCAARSRAAPRRRSAKTSAGSPGCSTWPTRWSGRARSAAPSPTRPTSRSSRACGCCSTSRRCRPPSDRPERTRARELFPHLEGEIPLLRDSRRLVLRGVGRHRGEQPVGAAADARARATRCRRR